MAAIIRRYYYTHFTRKNQHGVTVAMKNALVVVDYQYDFVAGALGFAGAETLDAGIAARVRTAAADGWDVIYTLDTHGADYASTREGRYLPTAHCVEGTPGFAVYGDTADALAEAGATEVRKNAFGSLELGELLKSRGYDRVELCGLVSGICVLACAVIALSALPHADVYVDPRLTASFDEKSYDASLEVMRGMGLIKA
jgi:nicotinamidase-related amidase